MLRRAHRSWQHCMEEGCRLAVLALAGLSPMPKRSLVDAGDSDGEAPGAEPLPDPHSMEVQCMGEMELRQYLHKQIDLLPVRHSTRKHPHPQ